ncbi:ABC transporter ATP-binding protein [Nonomuraea gerenzanensis]|uniref:Alpha-glucoside transport ATP-binding protein AglK n=1 Tax=Nonomuraea gerenzanensis TaxID=93944 RepID=A0A1M4E1X9_9ACTN|nr:ABC transporter ATP-binding protein [Nonomuraea gerenzanensis]UBU15104.1 ABC transporter ATP-binding protein [Nonomuraea gerenzanensis]SBO92847.1 Alpha-glucoside transport ATP-binding protein AglK [Nonomuraea gerenzanensis]
MSPVVKTVNLVKIYQDGAVPVPAVRGVDLQVEPGEFVAIMGPSGSGKSTLVHMLGGLDARTSGEIWLDGKRVDTLSESAWALLRRKKIGFVFQFFNLVANMTVGDNVELPALLAGASPKVARERRESLLAALNLTDRADAAPAQLSGGEQQRVALARALANEPSLLLADEPTGNLDSRNTRDVLRLLGEVHKQGQSIVMVTHDARVASLADRLVSLFDGEIVDDGRIARRRTRTAGEVIDLR